MKKTIKFILCVVSIFSTNLIAEEIKNSFSSVDENLLISQDEYVEIIRDTILSQPEFREILALKQQSTADRNYARRLRFPSLDARVFNDRTMSREIETNALRKTRDDTFDAVITIDQPIYTGNEIRSKIKIANLELNNSSIKTNQITSELILAATNIYLDAAISGLISDYSNNLLSKLEKYRDIAKKRFNAGISESTEMAIVNVRLSELETKNAVLESKKIESESVFEAFFNIKYNNFGLPKIELLEASLDNNFKENNYDERISKNDVKIAKSNMEIVKSQYRPRFGFNARYTRYDIDDEAKDKDLRGGFYMTFPFFNFGRGSAQVASSKAKINQANSKLDQVRRDIKYTKASNYGSLVGSLNARNKILDSYNNVKLQRETFSYQMGSTAFSITAYLEAAIREISIYEQLIRNEKQLLMSSLQTSHSSERLLNRFRIYIN
ncbi:MAG: hypothetical protein CMD06_00745 [Flavobacteriales bacterium]|nr:hypothetical protein [Flavobacteriales bacterium]|tara:strand:- start:838 stop:2157 length:1320 start_codon:yes stop_codon:yes gene_type:complete